MPRPSSAAKIGKTPAAAPEHNSATPETPASAPPNLRIEAFRIAGGWVLDARDPHRPADAHVINVTPGTRIGRAIDLIAKHVATHPGDGK
jgi:hypothetical protein